jgi:hypothetical protein
MRYTMNPDRSPKGGRQGQHLYMACARMRIMARVAGTVQIQNEIARTMKPPGVTLFSSFFNVAAIGGKRPRVVQL